MCNKKPNELLAERAKAFCIAAHSAVGQVRKYTNEPYWHHPLEVAELIKMHVPDASQEMLAAAMLHDVVEDTQVPLAVIRDQFGSAVANLVSDLSDVSKPEDGNRATRKEIDRQHTAAASPDAKSIKLADLISNTQSIMDGDAKFAKVYMAEKRLLLEVLCDGNETLLAIASKLVFDYFAIQADLNQDNSES
jgi:(p)ppGpp synthase/HD superfamily hydrolase